MLRRFLILAAIAAFALPAAAQNFTLVTGTITDPNNLAYSNALIGADLIGANPSPINGQAISGHVVTSANVNGAFSMTLARNAVVGGQWTFTVTTPGVPPPFGTGAQSFQATVTVNGASQDVSVALNAVAPAQTNGTGTSFGADLTYNSGTHTVSGSAVLTFNLSGITLLNLPTATRIGITGILKGNGVGINLSQAAVGDVTGLFSGTCNNTTFLRGDGACQTPAGSGTVNASPQFNLAYYPNAGSTSVVGGLSAPTDARPHFLQSAGTGAAAQAPTLPALGQPLSACNAGGTYIVLTTDVGLVKCQTTAASTWTLAQSGAAGFDQDRKSVV